MKTTLASSFDRFPFLKELVIRGINPGACGGPDDWNRTDAHELLPIVTPIDGSLIANLALASDGDYEHVVKAAREGFLEWRMTPAPVRGQIVREIGDELRRRKEPLGKLVTLEMGKIVAEGAGEGGHRRFVRTIDSQVAYTINKLLYP